MTALTYAEFGTAFVHGAVTPARITEVLASITGDTITVGPVPAGPGGAARATVIGALAPPQLEVTGTEPLQYGVMLPVTITLDVDVAGSRHRYQGDLQVRFGIAIHTEAPLTIVVEPARVSSRDVRVKVDAKGLRAKAIAALGDLDGELRREVAAYVNERMEGPDAAQVRRIDLLPLIDAAWSAGVV